jgi:hypothetical protein
LHRAGIIRVSIAAEIGFHADALEGRRKAYGPGSRCILPIDRCAYGEKQYSEDCFHFSLNLFNWGAQRFTAQRMKPTGNPLSEHVDENRSHNKQQSHVVAIAMPQRASLQMHSNHQAALILAIARALH